MCFSKSGSVVADWLEMKSGVASLLAALFTLAHSITISERGREKWAHFRKSQVFSGTSPALSSGNTAL